MSSTKFQVVILAYPGMTLLDAIGPNEVLANSPHFSVQFVASQTKAFGNDHGSFTLADLPHYSQIETADILLIPGGPGDHAQMQDPDLLNWIRQLDRHTRITASVCTGSLLLAKAGVLEGKKACSHWACLEELKAFNVQPKRQRFYQDGKYLTASGVSAGIDMALHLASILVSKKHASQLRFGIEYFPNQFQLLSSYSMPGFLLTKLTNKVKGVIQHTRGKWPAAQAD